MEEGESEAGKETAHKGVASSKACGHLGAVLLGLWGSQCGVVPCSQGVRKWGYFSTNLQEAQGSWMAGTQCHGMAVLKCPSFAGSYGLVEFPSSGSDGIKDRKPCPVFHAPWKPPHSLLLP